MIQEHTLLTPYCDIKSRSYTDDVDSLVRLFLELADSLSLLVYFMINDAGNGQIYAFHVSRRGAFTHKNLHDGDEESHQGKRAVNSRNGWIIEAR